MEHPQTTDSLQLINLLRSVIYVKFPNYITFYIFVIQNHMLVAKYGIGADVPDHLIPDPIHMLALRYRDIDDARIVGNYRILPFLQLVHHKTHTLEKRHSMQTLHSRDYTGCNLDYFQ